MGRIDADTAPLTRDFKLTTIIPPRVVEYSKDIRLNISQSAQLHCIFEAYPIDDYLNSVKWSKDQNTQKLEEKEISVINQNKTKVEKLNKKQIKLTIDLNDVSKKHNGTYTCVADSSYDRKTKKDLPNNGRAEHDINVFILDKPQISIEFMKAIGAREIYLNWTVNDGNLPIKNYAVQYQAEGSASFTYYREGIPGDKRSYVLDEFKPETQYKIGISAMNAIGSSPVYIHPQTIRTLKSDPTFLTVGESSGSSRDSITIGFNTTPIENSEFIHYHEVAIYEGNNLSTPLRVEKIYNQGDRNLPSFFDNVSVRNICILISILIIRFFCS